MKSSDETGIAVRCAECKAQAKREIASFMKQRGMDMEMIVKCTELSADEIALL